MSGLFLFFPVLLVLLLMLNVYIIIHYLAVKPKRKKEMYTKYHDEVSREEA